MLLEIKDGVDDMSSKPLIELKGGVELEDPVLTTFYGVLMQKESSSFEDDEGYTPKDFYINIFNDFALAEEKYKYYEEKEHVEIGVPDEIYMNLYKQLVNLTALNVEERDGKYYSKIFRIEKAYYSNR